MWLCRLCPGQGCSLVCCARCWSRDLTRRRLQASSCALQGGCLAMDDSPARVACAPAGTKRPIFIYPGAQAVSQEPPPPPSPRHQDRHLPPCRPQLSPSLLQAPLLCSGTSRAAFPRRMDGAAPPGRVLPLHPTRVSPPVRAGLQQLSPGSISSWDGCGSSLVGCGSQARALGRSVRGAHPKHTFGLWDLCVQHSAVLQSRVTQAGR